MYILDIIIFLIYKIFNNFNNEIFKYKNHELIKLNIRRNKGINEIIHSNNKIIKRIIYINIRIK